MSLLGKVSIFVRKHANRPEYQIMLRDPNYAFWQIFTSTTTTHFEGREHI